MHFTSVRLKGRFMPPPLRDCDVEIRPVESREIFLAARSGLWEDTPPPWRKTKNEKLLLRAQSSSLRRPGDRTTGLSCYDYHCTGPESAAGHEPDCAERGIGSADRRGTEPERLGLARGSARS